MIPNISPSLRLGVLTLSGSSGLNPCRGLLPPPPRLFLDNVFLRLSAGLFRLTAINGRFSGGHLRVPKHRTTPVGVDRNLHQLSDHIQWSLLQYHHQKEIRRALLFQRFLNPLVGQVDHRLLS